MKVDSKFVVLPVSETAGHFFNHLNLAVKPLGCSICYPMLEVRENIREVFFQRLGHFDDRCQA